MAADGGTTTGGSGGWQDQVIAYLTTNGLKIAAAMVVLVAGLLLARWVGKLTLRGLERLELQPPVRSLMARMAQLVVILMAALVALQTAGVQITPLVAGLGVAGVGVGLAMQGVLSNLVAGLTIIFVRPFVVGEYIEVVNAHGEVADIRLFSTVLLHADKSRVVIPNRKIVGEVLHNYGKMRQLSLMVTVGRGADVEAVLGLIRGIVAASGRALTEPAPVIGIDSVGEAGVTLAVKPWVKLADFVPAGPELYQAILTELQNRRVPPPAREVWWTPKDTPK